LKILTLVTLMAAACFAARGDQHAGCASVIAADGRVWNNVRMDWTSEPWLSTLLTKTTQEGWELAVKLSRMGVKVTQPSDEIRQKLRVRDLLGARALQQVSIQDQNRKLFDIFSAELVAFDRANLRA
jgi:hypothetical protein